jgi:hypothetical protein
MGITGLASFIIGVQKVVPMIPDFFALGAAFIVLGAGLLVTGAGMLLVGVGAAALAGGLLLLNMAAAGGTSSIGIIVQAFTDLWTQIPGMLAVGAALVVLGAGALALGAGVLLLGAGVLLLGTGLLVFSSAAYLGANAIQMIIDSFGKFAPIIDKATALGLSVNTLGGSFIRLAATVLASNVALMAVESALGNIQGSVGKVGKTIDDASGMFKSFATTVEKSMDESTTKATNGVDTLVKSMQEKTKHSLDDFKSMGKSMGKALDDGVAKGISDDSNSSAVMSAARRVIHDALKAMKKEADSNSPSKETAKLGKWLDQGLEGGLIKHSSIVEDAATGVAGGAISALKKALDGASDVVITQMDTQPTIRPVLDLTDVKKNAGLITDVLGDQKLPVTGAYLAAESILNSQRESQAAAANAETKSSTTEIKFEQNNYSPKALPAVEIYRNTKNGLSTLKGVTP